MASLTEFLDKPVLDPQGNEMARLRDLVVRVPTEGGRPLPTAEIYPPVVGLVARLKSKRSARDVFIPWDQVRGLDLDGVHLGSLRVNMRPFARRENEIVLRDGLFDRQVVDIEGRRVVRINDLDLTRQGNEWRLIGVDVGPGGLLRRVTGGRFGQNINRSPVIDWAQIVPVSHDRDSNALQLRVPRERLALLKPAELARVVEQLTPEQGADLLEGMDEAAAADTMEELEDEQQGQILRAMDPERAADVLEEMEPDEATDALQSITSEEAADLLRRMDREDATDVQELLGYPEDSAGGIMTTDYIAVPEWATIEAVMAAMRAQVRAAANDEDDPLPDAFSEIYIVAEDGIPTAPMPPAARNAARARGRTRATPRPAPTVQKALSLWTEGRLLGRASLQDLILADPLARVDTVMRPLPHVAHPLDHEQDVARCIADDDLIALPVVDDNDHLLGIVTVDDAIDVILPTAWKKRLPRVFH